MQVFFFLSALSYLYSASYQVQLLIYFMLKFAMEILISESSVVTTFYFKWATSTVAILLAVLGLTVLPVNIIVGSYVTNLFQDRYVIFIIVKPVKTTALLFSCLHSAAISLLFFFHAYFSCLSPEGKFWWPPRSWC
jgi:hypothetical protein